MTEEELKHEYERSCLAEQAHKDYINSIADESIRHAVNIQAKSLLVLMTGIVHPSPEMALRYKEIDYHSFACVTAALKVQYDVGGGK